MISANGSIAYLQILRTTQNNDDYEVFYETACVRACVCVCVCVCERERERENNNNNNNNNNKLYLKMRSSWI